MHSSTALAMKLPASEYNPTQSYLVGERALLARLLEEAENTLTKELSQPQGPDWEHWLLDYLWITTEEENPFGLSFRYICDHLGYDAQVIQEQFLLKVPEGTLQLYRQWSSNGR